MTSPNGTPDALVRLQRAVQHAASVTMLLDSGGTVLSVSDAFTRLLGHPSEQVVGARLAGFAKHQKEIEATIARATSEGAARCDTPMRMATTNAVRPLHFEMEIGRAHV